MGVQCGGTLLEERYSFGVLKRRLTMNVVIAKSKGLVGVLVILPRATVHGFTRGLDAFVGAIERHALGK